MFIESKSLEYEDFPKLPCPTCQKGVLRILNETIIKKYPGWFENLPDTPEECYNEEGEREYVLSKFHVEDTEAEEFLTSFYLKCDRKQCNEIVATCGITKLLNYGDYDSNGELIDCSILLYYPRIFFPSIRLFEIPTKTPAKIVYELENAFALFWMNPSASGNSVRKTLEILLDELEGPSNDKLHIRIVNLDGRYSEIKDFLLASKWIGNDGSHESDLTHDDVIIAFRFIKACLEKLFIESKMDLNFIAQQINTEKKAMSKFNQSE